MYTLLDGFFVLGTSVFITGYCVVLVLQGSLICGIIGVLWGL